MFQEPEHELEHGHGPSQKNGSTVLHYQEGSSIEVYCPTKPREHKYAPDIYGHYEGQSEMINGRPYFKNGIGRGIWWDGKSSWMIGNDSSKGSEKCSAYFEIDVMSPLQINEFNGMLLDEEKKWINSRKLLAFKRSKRGKCVLCSRYLLMYTEKKNMMIKILSQHQN